MSIVKICGLKNYANLSAVENFTPDMVGFNFYEGSVRFIEPSSLSKWIAKVSPKIAKVGLFVNKDIAEIEKISKLLSLDAVQLHGDESHELCKSAMQFGCKVYKAIRLENYQNLHAIEKYSFCDGIFLDAFVASDKGKIYGGTGKTLDWDEVAKIVGQFPEIDFFLSGGLTPGNVSEAILKVKPLGVDVASGVEISPGIKSPQKVREFVENSRESFTKLFTELR